MSQSLSGSWRRTRGGAVGNVGGALSRVTASLFLSLPSSVPLNMPWPFRKLGREVKSLFRSSERDRRRSADHPGVVDGAATASLASPSTATDLLPPVVVVTPTLSMVDLLNNKNTIEPEDTGRYRPSPSLVHPSIDSSSHPSRSPSQRPSFGATGAPRLYSQSSDTSATDTALSAFCQEPVRELEFALSPNRAQLLPTPSPKDAVSASPLPTPLAPSTSYFSNSRDFTVSQLNVHNGFSHSKTLFECKFS